MLKIFSLEKSVNEIVHKITITSIERKKNWKHINQNVKSDIQTLSVFFLLFEVSILIFQNKKYSINKRFFIITIENVLKPLSSFFDYLYSSSSSSSGQFVTRKIHVSPELQIFLSAYHLFHTSSGTTWGLGTVYACWSFNSGHMDKSTLFAIILNHLWK